MTIPTAKRAQAGAGLRVANLLNDLDGLVALLRSAAAEQWWLDAFLVAAGIEQIVCDHLHDAPYPLDDIISVAEAASSAVGRLAAAAARGGANTTRLVRARMHRRVAALHERAALLVDELAMAVVSGVTRDDPLSAACEELAAAIAALPGAVRAGVVRLPACFQQFDQSPADLARLADRYLERAAVAAVLVVGVRTSGCYLAPLLAAELRVRGCGARALTIRPGRPLLAAERAVLREHAGGDVLLIDDPPVSGASLASAARQLERLGVARHRIVLLLALAGDDAVPPRATAAYEAVTLAPGEWEIDGRLAPAGAARDLAELLEGEMTVEALDALPSPMRDRRGHRHALLRVRGRALEGGAPRELTVLASGTGLGYLGAHALAVADALRDHAPRILGLREGVLYREWLPSDLRADARSPGFARAVAGYVDARRRALPAARDPTVAMHGQRPVWEVAALLLGGAFGRAGAPARVALIEPAIRRLLRVARPSLTDGSTSTGHWFADRDGRTIKVSMHERTYWSRGLTCFDAAFDLAGVGVCADDPTLPARLRDTWHERTGEEIEPERWLLYELAHLWGRVRADPADEPQARHAGARALQRYFAATLLAGPPGQPDGPLVALDVDGVLETEHLRFASLTRAGAASLRALVTHGYRPVPVTGRGLDEVVDRCRAYGLVGGVAEYGSAIWLQREGRSVALTGHAHAAALDRLRAVLSELDGVLVDPAFRHAVRAYRLRGDGERRPLPGELVTESLTLARCAGHVAVIDGDGQTDFVAAGVDKGTGLRALAAELSPGGAPAEVALAVGDSASDVPMLALGRRACVPAHAKLGAGTTRMGLPYQAGLALAVAELLGHDPGGCAACRLPPEPPARRLLLDLLSAGERGRSGLLGAGARIARGLR